MVWSEFNGVWMIMVQKINKTIVQRGLNIRDDGAEVIQLRR